MSPRAFQYLLWTTLVAVVAALAVSRMDQTPGVARAGGGDSAAPFASRARDVAKVIIEAPNYQLTLEKRGENWVAADRGAYPVRASAVANLLTSLGAMRLAERKTSKPVLYAEIGVEDYKTGAGSTALAFHYADGASAGGVLIGKRSNSASFDQTGATFVRRAGEAQAWLAQGAPLLPREFSEWFVELPAVPATEVQGVAISEGGRVVFEARKSAEGLYARADALEPAANDTAVKRVAQALVGTGFEDVRPVSAITNVRRNVRLDLGAGKHIDVLVGEGAGQIYVSFAGDATGVAGDVIKLSKGFAYRLPTYRLSGLTQPLAELTAEEQSSTPAGMPPQHFMPPGAAPGGMPPGFPLPGMPR